MIRRSLEFRTVPLEKVTTPVSGHRDVYVDYWWAVSEDECVYVYGNRPGSPQCNQNKMVFDKLLHHVESLPGFKEVRQIPYVSFPINFRDYM